MGENLQSPLPSASPLVVACVPVYNAEGFVGATLRSLQEQTYGNLRILVSDDASTDGTADYCASIAKDDPRMQFFRQKTRLGWVGNLNALLQTAGEEAEYVFFAAHDDILLPTFTSRLTEVLSRSPDAVLAFSDLQDIGVDGTSTIVSFDFPEDQRSAATRAAIMAGKPEGWWVPFRGIIRNDVARRLGGLRLHRAGDMSADWPWLLGLAIEGDFVRVPEVLCRKVRRNDSLSKTWHRTAGTFIASIASSNETVRRSNLTLRAKIKVRLRLLHLALRLVKWDLLRRFA